MAGINVVSSLEYMQRPELGPETVLVSWQSISFSEECLVTRGISSWATAQIWAQILFLFHNSYWGMGMGSRQQSLLPWFFCNVRQWFPSKGSFRGKTKSQNINKIVFHVFSLPVSSSLFPLCTYLFSFSLFYFLSFIFLYIGLLL